MAPKIELLRNTQAECFVLASCIAEENIFKVISDELTIDLFTDEDCQKVFKIIKQIEKEGKIPELTEVGMRAAEQGIEIAGFMFDTSSFSVTRQRVELLQELATKRKIYAICAKALELATDPTTTADELQQVLSSSVEATSEKRRLISLKDVLGGLKNDVALRMDGANPDSIMTGLNVLDERFGLHGGDLVVIAGETSQGKSALATTIARNMASDGVPVAYYSLEMGAKQLAARIVARDVHLPSSRLLYDRLSDEEFATFYDKSIAAENLPIYFDEANKTSLEKVCTSVRVMARERGVKVVFIDYIQIFVNGARQDNREQELADIARTFKRLAVETGVCIVALSQLSRDPNNREPTVARLRGSGQIEEAADTVILIYRPEVYGIQQYPHTDISTSGNAKIIIGKGRNIGIGEDFVGFDSTLTHFFNLESQPPQLEQSSRPWTN